MQSREQLLTAWLTLTEDSASGLEAGTETVRLPVLSGSMLPAIPLGANLVIAPCTAAEVKRGDVVVFQDGDRLVAHRLLLRLQIGPLHVLFQKGDDNIHGSWISPGQIKGRVLTVERDQDILTAFSESAASASLLHFLKNLHRKRS